MILSALKGVLARLDLKKTKIKLKIRNLQISQNIYLAPWELKNREYREKSLPLVEKYFFNMFCKEGRISISLIDGAKSLKLRRFVFFQMMNLLENRDLLIQKSGHNGCKPIEYFCTKKGKQLLQAIHDRQSLGKRIPKRLKPSFYIKNNSIKFL